MLYLGFSELGEPLVLLFLVTVLADDGIYECVVDITQDGNGRVDFCEFFDGDNGSGERRLCPTMIRARFNAHKLVR